MDSLNDKVIVITGASSGIGLATALAAAENGASLVLNARSAETLDEICDLIRSGGASAAPFRATFQAAAT